MRLRDSHRLTGPNLTWDAQGAALEVVLSAAEADSVIQAWRECATAILHAVGWESEQLAVRQYDEGASLAMSAPEDALYAACEVNEWAWDATVAQLGGEGCEALETAAARLRATIDAEADPARSALQIVAQARGLLFLADDELVTLGSGAGSCSYPVSELPDPDAVDWDLLRNVPTVLVTGTNGKSTTVRLLSAMAEHAGHTVGTCSTDRVMVGGETLATGDYSGPEGARRVLRDRRTTVAFLETARGGLLRRGLAVGQADAAVVLNVDADHLGEGGVDDVQTLARVKLLVGRAVPRGPLILCADDPYLVAQAATGLQDGERSLPPLLWFSLDPDAALLRSALARGEQACFLDGRTLVHAIGSERQVVADLGDVPMTMGGAARFNVHNALAAIAAAVAIGLERASIAAGLASFASSPEDNPGRGNHFDLGGVHVVVDFAHNAHGMRAILEMAAAMPAKRRLVVLGQAGDRSDESVRDMVQAAWAARPDRIIVKRMLEHQRGRDEDEMVDLIRNELLALGVPPETIAHSDSELDAVHAALAWARPGDLLILPTHAQRSAVLALMQDLAARGWRPSGGA